MTALVLGATGLIGSHSSAELSSRGLEVVGTSRSGTGGLLPLDLTDPVAVDRLVDELKPEVVVHAAGMSSLTEAWQRPADNFRLNTTAVFNLLEALRRHVPDAHLVFTSSAGVYGQLRDGDLPFTEESPLRPASPYAAAKAAAEVLCGQYSREYGMSIAVTRIFNQVGPGQSVSQAPSEFAREIALAESRRETAVALKVGNPDAERDFTDVRDTARAIASLASGRISGTFNVCSGRETSLYELVWLLGLTSNLEVSVAGKPDHHRRADVSRIVGSPAKLEAATGWKAETPLHSSLALLLDDWRTNRISPHDD